MLKPSRGRKRDRQQTEAPRCQVSKHVSFALKRECTRVDNDGSELVGGIWRVGDIVEFDGVQVCSVDLMGAERPKFGHITGENEAGDLLVRVLVTASQLPQVWLDLIDEIILKVALQSGRLYI